MATIGQTKAAKSKTGSYTSSSGKTYTSSKSSGVSGGDYNQRLAEVKSAADKLQTGINAYATSKGFTNTKNANGIGYTSTKGSSYDTPNPTISSESVAPTPKLDITPTNLAPTIPGVTPPNAPASNMGIVDTLNQAGQKSDFASPSTLASQNGIQGYTGTAQNTDLASRYQTGFGNAVNAGGATPTTSSDGSKMVGANMPSTQPDTSFVDQTLQDEPVYSKILDSWAEIMSPQKQTETLAGEYDRMVKKSGLEGINMQLINTQKIIEGTEQDIRNEVTAVSGFATDSQVLALASARNKSLMQNYNGLLATRDSIQQQIDTHMQLSKEDRQIASERMTQQLNLGFKILEFRDRAKQNATDAYNNVVKAVGYKGLYDSLSQDPHALGIAEKVLGLAQGQMQGLASYVAPLSEMDKLDLEGKRLSNQKLRGELAGGGSDKKLSVSEAKELGVPYGTTQSQAEKMGIIPGAVNGVDEQTMSKIQASPEYKTINSVLPAISSLKAYKDAINKYGTTEQWSGTGKGELAGTYGNALSTWKTLATLGALSGADFGLAENAVPETGFFKRSATSKAKLTASIDNAISQVENMTKRLSQNYPNASKLLNQQLDEMKVTAYPDRYAIGDDGQVYEAK